MKGYFDQIFKTKFSKQTLAKIGGFQWVVDEMETEFIYPELDIKTFDDFFSTLAKYKYHVEYFIRIYEIDDSPLNINQEFIRLLSNIAQYSLKKGSIKGILTNNKYKNFTILYILGLIGGIVEKKKDPGYYNFGMFVYYNWFELYQIKNMSKKNRAIIEGLLKKLNILETPKIKEIYIKNLNNTLQSYEKKNIGCLKNNNDLFCYKEFKRNQFCTWQEDYILKMASMTFTISKIVPLFSSRYGKYPDYDMWSEDIIKNMKDFFCEEATAMKVLNLIDYKLHNVQLDETMQIIVLKQCLNIIQTKKNTRDYDNIWFSILLTCIKDKKSYIRKNMGSIYIALKRRRNSYILLFLKSNGFPMDNELDKKIDNYYIRLRKSIGKIEDLNELNDFMADKYIQKNINVLTLEKLRKVFYKLIELNENNILVAKSFYIFVNFLIEIKGKFNNDVINCYIFELLGMWQGKYYNKIHSLLQHQTYSTTIKSEEIKKYNQYFMSNPIVVLRNEFSWTEEKILKQMIPISEHALATIMKANTIYIDEFFPYYKRINTPRKETLEHYICDYLDKLQIKYEEQLLNPNIKPIDYYQTINDNYGKSVKVLMNFISEENFKQMYNEIRESFLEYELLDYPERITVAHITQLIPLLELMIRELAIKNKIVPFKEQQNEIHIMKDSTNILITILENTYKRNNSFEEVEVYFFLYNCFYNVNSLNIRNELIHAREYLNDVRKMEFAFRTLIIGIFWANIELLI